MRDLKKKSMWSLRGGPDLHFCSPQSDTSCKTMDTGPVCGVVCPFTPSFRWCSLTDPAGMARRVGADEIRTRDLAISSPTLYHTAICVPLCVIWQRKCEFHYHYLPMILLILLFYFFNRKVFFVMIRNLFMTEPHRIHFYIFIMCIDVFLALM